MIKLVIKKSVFLGGLLLLIGSCTLNSNQEKSLNIHISKYIDSRNSCKMLGIVGYTYPEFVSELKMNNDSTFLSHFECEKNKKHYTNPTIRSSKKKNNQIHILFELDETIQKHKERIISISVDNGMTWYFLPDSIYQDRNKCKNLNRLITIN